MDTETLKLERRAILGWEFLIPPNHQNVFRLFSPTLIHQIETRRGVQEAQFISSRCFGCSPPCKPHILYSNFIYRGEPKAQQEQLRGPGSRRRRGLCGAHPVVAWVVQPSLLFSVHRFKLKRGNEACALNQARWVQNHIKKLSHCLPKRK